MIWLFRDLNKSSQTNTPYLLFQPHVAQSTQSPWSLRFLPAQVLTQHSLHPEDQGGLKARPKMHRWLRLYEGQWGVLFYREVRSNRCLWGFDTFLTTQFTLEEMLVTQSFTFKHRSTPQYPQFCRQYVVFFWVHILCMSTVLRDALQRNQESLWKILNGRAHPPPPLPLPLLLLGSARCPPVGAPPLFGNFSQFSHFLESINNDTWMLFRWQTWSILMKTDNIWMLIVCRWSIYYYLLKICHNPFGQVFEVPPCFFEGGFPSKWRWALLILRQSPRPSLLVPAHFLCLPDS